MADEDGGCCCVKFYDISRSNRGTSGAVSPVLAASPPPRTISREEAKARATRECKAWTRAYSDENYNVRVAELYNKSVLIMPFFEPISAEEWGDDETRTIALEHIMELFRKGARHKDVEARHVMWRDKISRSVVLVDWGVATNVEWSDRSVKDFSEEEYLDYAKQKLDVGIDALKKKHLKDTQAQEAEEAARAAEAVRAVNAARAVAAKAEAAVNALEKSLGRTRSATDKIAAEKAEQTKALEAAKKEVQVLEAAIEAANKARKQNVEAHARAKSMFKAANEAAKAAKAAMAELAAAENDAKEANTASKRAEATKRVVKATNAANAARDAANTAANAAGAAAQAAANAKHAAVAAGVAASSATNVWMFDPVDDFETRKGWAPDKFDATKTEVIKMDPAKLFALRAKQRLATVAEGKEEDG